MDRIFTVTFPGLCASYDDRCGSTGETHSPVEGAILNRELRTVISQRILWNLRVLGPCLVMAGFDLLEHWGK
ncbi:MAG: hypothetical protein ACJ0BN_13970 [Limisphaerales bacterium]|nr:hypothetical protein [Verrucomicrobiae bacterium]